MVHLEPVAIVTGATRGIGKAIVQKLSSQGISCICIGSSRESIAGIKLGDHLQSVKENQRHRSLAIDLSQWPQWVAQKSHFGIEYYPQRLESMFPLMGFNSWNSPHQRYCLSLVVNCAGTTQSSISLRTSTEEMQRIMNINFLSTVSMCDLATRSMIRQRSHSGALPLQIVNISSVLGETELAVKGTSIYSASKAAISHYSKVLSQEVSNWGIRVNTIAPGLVNGTDMIKGLDDTAQTALMNLMATSNRRSTPQEIASSVWSIYSDGNYK
ncbi:hypothetical protein ZYGR_0P02640 [Zygosaccharomyces rouxii]|uniref:ZYRO0E06732p n=2 Tax=Zygosaccharomyces rouxii TaxID=4956 RepID=C5E4J9_ZYGRC|nr:uncharacterized protein ZYRO0E06732g [Zygosaccharomyces rouxii]KAH9198183.1 hypothetical protein LQ764DRAFT_154996 [Zygosaccharomyces rouxii]GAV49619.1 hypothetical protein ZYGR_0P02640 [Zygosaccharomyces rouxii]CAR30960.1 ZYRO0E06732p [Zygosaccharomyces rouxii]